MANKIELYKCLLSAFIEHPGSGPALHFLKKTLEKDPKIMPMVVKGLWGVYLNNGLNEDAYQEKYSETFEEAVQKLKSPDLTKACQSACRLIEWHKFFVSLPEISFLLMGLELFGLESDIHDLSKAITKTKKKKLRKHWLLLGSIKYFLKTEPALDVIQLTKRAISLGQKLQGLEWPENDPSYKLLQDEQEIEKFIRRNKDLIFK